MARGGLRPAQRAQHAQNSLLSLASAQCTCMLSPCKARIASSNPEEELGHTLRSLAIVWLRERSGVLPAQFSSSFLRRGLLGSFSSAFNLPALFANHQQFLCIQLGSANQFHPQSAGAASCVIWQKVASRCRLSALKASSALGASLCSLGSFPLVLESKCAAPTRPFLATGKTRTRLLAIFVATRHLSAACNDLLQGE